MALSISHTIRIWDAVTGKELRKLERYPNNVFSAAFSPDGEVVIIAVGSCGEVYDAEMNIVLQEFEGHTNTIYSVTFSPDSKMVVTASHDKTAQIWNLKITKPNIVPNLEPVLINAPFRF
ncbi:MAG: hypothetical protein LBC02_08755 [Planctomycetaceae bacterium]|nr:hypothetical protein [Planctomycetaceae bacterium]